jgi:hypothetical protein
MNIGMKLHVYLYSNSVLEGQAEVAIGVKGAERAEFGIF